MCNACAEFLLNPNSKHATISIKSRVFPTLNPKHDEDEADGQVAEVEGFWHSVRQGGSEFRAGFRVLEGQGDLVNNGELGLLYGLLGSLTYFLSTPELYEALSPELLKPTLQLPCTVVGAGDRQSQIHES